MALQCLICAMPIKLLLNGVHVVLLWTNHILLDSFKYERGSSTFVGPFHKIYMKLNWHWGMVVYLCTPDLPRLRRSSFCCIQGMQFREIA